MAALDVIRDGYLCDVVVLRDEVRTVAGRREEQRDGHVLRQVAEVGRRVGAQAVLRESVAGARAELHQLGGHARSPPSPQLQLRARPVLHQWRIQGVSRVSRHPPFCSGALFGKEHILKTCRYGF